MARKNTSDPTKDPEFERVVQHFLNTPPQPRKPLGKKLKKKRAASSKPKTDEPAA